ncbi:glutamate synthase central domain-containing protein [Cupriavidus basilensis]
MHPYLAMETLADMAQGLSGDLSPEKAVKNFVKAVGKGLQKVMSKMGISTYMSYTGAQIFEAIGLSRELVQKYFHGTASKRRRHRHLRGGRGSAAPAPGRLWRQPGAGHHARHRRRVRLPCAWRRAHVDPGFGGQAAARRACRRRQGRVPDVQGIRQHHQRPEPPSRDAARPVRVQG